MQRTAFSRNQVATAIAILFHSIGFVGICFFNRDFFIQTSALNLLLMFGLLVYTHPKPDTSFYMFILACFITGIAVEVIGTKTGLMFGDYAYGNVLGPSWMNVPLIIGINWFIVVYCCGVAVHTLLQKVIDAVPDAANTAKPIMKKLSLVVDAATMAVLFDWLMEPVAVKLGYWHWKGDGEIPWMNYGCWFMVSALLMLLFVRFPMAKQNKFAIHLLLIQVMFFLMLRTFL